MRIKEEIEEVRAMLGEEYGFLPDITIERMIYAFKLMAKLMIKDMERVR